MVRVTFWKPLLLLRNWDRLRTNRFGVKMRNEKEIRWQQRFQNLEKAFAQLEDVVKIKNPSMGERAGLIQLFEVSFELAWKTLNDYLESKGFRMIGPRDTFKQAFQSGLIQDGHGWMEALKDRNLTTHTYKEETAKIVENTIREKYFGALKDLIQTLRKQIEIK